MTNDVIQELFITLWNNRETIQIQTSLSAYLFAAVRNRIIRIFSHERVRSDYTDSLLLFSRLHPGVANTDYLVRERDLKAQIQLEIARLPEKMRKVFVLSREASLTQHEIAGELGISKATVNKQVKNALRILRLRLGAWLFLLLFFI
jgi:RNA polymerase sigma-70 factor (family 1)